MKGSRELMMTNDLSGWAVYVCPWMEDCLECEKEGVVL